MTSMQKSTRLSLIVAALLMVAGCAATGFPTAGSDRTRADGTATDIKVAAFKYLFENNASAFGATVSVYCVGEGEPAQLRDADANLRRALSAPSKRIEPASKCARDAMAMLTETGEQALIFHIDNVLCASDTQCTFEGGYYEGNASSSNGEFAAEQQRGRWTIKPVGPQVIS